MWVFVKEKWAYFYSTFRGSDTIVWARLQMAMGALLATVLTIDPHTITDLPPKYVVYWVIANGFISEMMRRRKEDWKDEEREEAYNEDEHRKTSKGTGP